MKKIIILCKNEFIKLFKKKSTILLLIIAILSLFGSAGISKLSEKTESNYNRQSKYEYIKYEIESLKNQMNEVSVNKDELQIRIDMLQYAYENKIDMSYNPNWQSELIEKIISKKVDLYRAKKSTDIDVLKTVTALETDVTKLDNILKSSDFNSYIDLQIESINNSYKNGDLTKEEADEQIELANLTKKYEIGKDDKGYTWRRDVFSEISNIKRSLRLGMDISTNKLLSFEDTQKLNDNLKLDLYRLDNNIEKTAEYYGSINYKKLYESMAEKMSMMCLGIFLIISAGASISTEFSKGTIKFLAMTPNKRWKILISKLITYTIILIIGTIVLSLISIFVGNLFFPQSNISDYIYISNGNIHQIDHNIYEFIRFISYDIDIFIYILFAVMLSVVTRNTSVAISITIAFYLGAGTAMQIINQFIHSEWIKFIPFNNMNITDVMFSNDANLISSTSSISQQIDISLLFSVCVLIVSGILMIVTMFDSFNNRDIN